MQTPLGAATVACFHNVPNVYGTPKEPSGFHLFLVTKLVSRCHRGHGCGTHPTKKSEVGVGGTAPSWAACSNFFQWSLLRVAGWLGEYKLFYQVAGAEPAV